MGIGTECVFHLDESARNSSLGQRLDWKQLCTVLQGIGPHPNRLNFCNISGVSAKHALLRLVVVLLRCGHVFLLNILPLPLQPVSVYYYCCWTNRDVRPYLSCSRWRLCLCQMPCPSRVNLSARLRAWIVTVRTSRRQKRR
jgi:hypothetical protein